MLLSSGPSDLPGIHTSPSPIPTLRGQGPPDPCKRCCCSPVTAPGQAGDLIWHKHPRPNPGSSQFHIPGLLGCLEMFTASLLMRGLGFPGVGKGGREEEELRPGMEQWERNSEPLQNLMVS